MPSARRNTRGYNEVEFLQVPPKKAVQREFSNVGHLLK